MMAGMLGVATWLMMGAMLAGFAAGGIAWLRRRLKRPDAGCGEPELSGQTARYRHGPPQRSPWSG
jgi:hypothetical protein